MSKRLGIVLGAIVAVGLIVLAVVGAAGAQGNTSQSPQATPQAQTPPKAGPPGRGPGGGGMDEIAKLLGMTSDQIWAERVLGKTIADLAKEKGVDTQQLVDALVASQKTMLDQMVTNGRFTQAQADKWLEWYKQSAALQLTEPYGPGLGGLRGGPVGPGGPGGMRGPRPERQSSDAPQPAPTQ